MYYPFPCWFYKCLFDPLSLDISMSKYPTGNKIKNSFVYKNCRCFNTKGELN